MSWATEAMFKQLVPPDDFETYKQALPYTKIIDGTQANIGNYISVRFEMCSDYKKPKNVTCASPSETLLYAKNNVYAIFVHGYETYLDLSDIDNPLKKRGTMLVDKLGGIFFQKNSLSLNSYELIDSYLHSFTSLYSKSDQLHKRGKFLSTDK